MSSRTLTYCVAVATSAVALAGGAGAATYSAVGDFSIASNPNGAWAYGTGVAGSSFTAMTNSGTGVLGSDFQYW